MFAAGNDTATLTIATENYRAPRGVAMTISATLLDPDNLGEPRVYRPGTTGPVLITVRDVSLPGRHGKRGGPLDQGGRDGNVHVPAPERGMAEIHHRHRGHIGLPVCKRNAALQQ